MKDGSSLIKVLILEDSPLTVYKSNNIGRHHEKKQNLFLIVLFTNQNKPKTLEIFFWEFYRNCAFLTGILLSTFIFKESTGSVNETSIIFSQKSNSLGYCDKINTKLNSTKILKDVEKKL